ncbi:MAG TPA: GNAT family N-acetyltransferase [Chthonomonadaceae bacterium]|nr:GNAT family N-acetyltransferase [Chthonomonadaceae bacterium]
MSGRTDSVRVRVVKPEIDLRAADPEDRPRAREVQWAVGWKDAPTEHLSWPEADTDWQARRYYREIVAEVDGIIAARIGLEAYRQPFAELIDLCVRPEYRRLGLGELLTREAERQSARRGFRALFLQTEMDNSAAHRLYTGLGFVPTAYGTMLRMVKLIDCPLLTDFKRLHPLTRYFCSPAPDAARAWIMEWHAYITEDYLRLRLESGASKSDSEGIGPAITGCEWCTEQGARALSIRFGPEPVRDIEPGNHVETTITLTNQGRRVESGVFQMALPPGIEIASPATNRERALLWQAQPGETVTQPVVLLVEPGFDSSVLHELNYGSVPVSTEVYWERRRVLLNVSLPFATPPS